MSQDTEKRVSETKHTPGPMEVGHDGPSRPIILCADGSMLSVSKFVDGRWTAYDQEEAHAALFAAAPELFIAAKTVIKAAEAEGWDIYRGTDEPRTGLAGLRSAIAKAEGRL